MVRLHRSIVFRSIVFAVALWAAVSPALAADDGQRPAGLWDGVLETLDLKAKPADPPPDFVRKTRPDSSRLRYMQRPVPHKVSPIPVKTPGEVEAAKNALDAAREKQLQPTPPQPIQLVKPKKAAAAKGATPTD